MKCVSIIVEAGGSPPPEGTGWRRTVESLRVQNHTEWECILVGPGTSHGPAEDRIRVLRGKFESRAQALNRGIAEASGDFVMIVDSRDACAKLRRSSLELFVMAAERHPETGMVYADYCREDGDGNLEGVRLLSPHPGRLRDNQDYGSVLFFPLDVLRAVGGLDEAYRYADLYDLRLRVSEGYRLVHLKAARNGHAYTVKSSGAVHDVFDYLMAGRDQQHEAEAALTGHLKRIGAYLEPGAHYREVENPGGRHALGKECIASVVIPVFDREAFIGTAIESVRVQTVPNIEVIVVCNGGKDDPTIRGVRPYLEGGERHDPHKPRVRLFVEDINNIGYCLNRGIREARGRYYIQLDSDDRLKPDAVEKMLAVFATDPRIGMVIGSYEVWEMEEQTREIRRREDIPVVTHGEWTEENGRNNLLRINGAGAPRAAHIGVIRELGGFGMNDEACSYNYGEDYDLVLRISECYRIGRVWEPIYEVIRHSGGTDHSIDQATIDRNDNAKDTMRAAAIRRRKALIAEARP